MLLGTAVVVWLQHRELAPSTFATTAALMLVLWMRARASHHPAQVPGPRSESQEDDVRPLVDAVCQLAQAAEDA